MLSLTNESGTPVSTFGTGVAFSNSQVQANPGTFGDSSLFGALGSNGSGGSGNASAITPTKAGSTADMGYQALKGKGAHGSPMKPSPMKAGGKLLTTDEDFDVNGPAGKIVKSGYNTGLNQAQQQLGRLDSMRQGMGEARPGQDMPGEGENDGADDANATENMTP